MSKPSITDFIKQHQWLVFQENDNPQALVRDSALAYQDTFLRYVLDLNDRKETQSSPYAVLHFYPQEKPSIYLGAKDKMISQFPKAVDHLIQKGYQVSIRPHGGLGVVEDKGILNIGLVSDRRQVDLSIDEAYDLMIGLIRLALDKWDLEVEAYEIENSYCPGKFDIVINHKKVGGIAQRRYKDGVATAAYLGINGDQIKRGQLMKDFYTIGEANHQFPEVNPSSMTTLSAILGQELSVEECEAEILAHITSLSEVKKGNYQEENLQSFYQPLFEKAYERSEKIQPKVNN